MKTKEELEKIKSDILEKTKPIYTFPVEMDDEGTIGTFYFKKPGRLEMAAIQKGAASADSLRATEIFIAQCYLGGDDKALLNADNYDALKQVETGMLEVVKAKSIEIKQK